jgi:PST family polysaccharide transporter
VRQLINIGWLSIEQIVRIGLSFVVMVLVARHLGPERFGAYAYLFSVAGLLTPLTVFGLEAIAMRRLVSNPDQRDQILGTALLIRIVGSLIAVAASIGFVASFGGPEGVTVGLMALAALILPFLPSDVFNNYFKATGRMAWVAVPRIAVQSAIAIGAIWLVFTGAGIAGFTTLRIGESVLLAVEAALAYQIVAKALFRMHIDWRLLQILLREGAPLFLASLAVMIYMRTDQIMLGQLSSGKDLGFYSVAVPIAQSAFFVPMAMHAAFYATLVRAHATNAATFDVKMRRFYDIMGLVMLGMMGVIVIAATVAIPLLGPEFAPARLMVWVLVLGLPFVGLGIASSAMQTIRGWLWTSSLTTLAGAVANIIMNLMLIPAYGGVGAAAATVASEMKMISSAYRNVERREISSHNLLAREKIRDILYVADH